MNNKIDVEDLTGDSKPNSQQSAMEERIRSFCSIGEDEAITEDVAKALPTPILIMSVTNFPSMAQEVGTAQMMAASSGNNEVSKALIKSIKVMNTSYLSCARELEIRIPARATLEEVGLVEEPEEE